MTDAQGPLTDAQYVRNMAVVIRDLTPLGQASAERLFTIADRLEKIDAQEALKSGQDVPKIFIPLNYAQACADAGMPISWVVEEGKKP